MKLTTIEANTAMMDALKGASATMAKVNENMDIHAIQQLMKDFAKQSSMMEM